MKLTEYIKNDFNLAKKSLLFNYKKYICFVIVLLLVQTVLSSVILIQYNYGKNQEQFLEEKYTNSQGMLYHVRLRNLNETQYSELRILELSQTEEDVYFQIAGGTESYYELESGSRFKIFDIDIKFITEVTGSSLRECYNRFRESAYPALQSEGNYDEFVTPLLNFKMRQLQTSILNMLIILLIFFISFLSLWSMHSSNLSYHRFTYGMYISTGATFERLFFTAVWEMFLMALFVWIPSTVISSVISWLVVRNTSAFIFWFPAFLISAALSFFASLIVVFINYKKIASAEPVNLLRATDNADVISSPKTSEPDFLLYSFPEKVENLSLKRYRKHLIKLILSATFITSVFVGIITLSDIYVQSLNYPKPEFSLDFIPRIRYEETEVIIPGSDDPEDENYGKEPEKKIIRTEIKEYDYYFDDYLESELLSSGAVAAVDKDCSVTAGEINSHAVLPSKSVKAGKGIKVSDGKALYNVLYSALDENLVNYLEFIGCKIDGNINDVLNSSDMIAVSDSINNRSAFRLKVGDKIRIAVVKGGQYVELNPMEIEMADYDNILSTLLSKYEYRYKEYVVGAIIKGVPSDSRFRIYLNGQAYTGITKTEAKYNHASVIMSENASDEDIENIGRFLRNSSSYYKNMSVTALDTAVNRQTEKNKNYYPIYLVIAFMILLVSPLIWVVSQQLFYDKRKTEFTVLQSMGAQIGEIKKLFIRDAMIFTAIGCISFTVLSVIFNVLVNNLMNTPQFFMLITGENSIVRFSYDIPWTALVIGLLLTGASSLFSIFISYRSYIMNCPSVFGGKDSETDFQDSEVLYGSDY